MLRKEEITPSRKRLFEMIKEKEVVAEEECDKCGGDHDTKDHDKKEDECTPN